MKTICATKILDGIIDAHILVCTARECLIDEDIPTALRVGVSCTE